MKIGIYSPYIPKHFGGGEKYIFDVALCLSELGHQVDILLPNYASKTQGVELEEIITKYEKFLGITLSQIHFTPSPLGSKGSAVQKYFFTTQYDCMYLVTDGSLFFTGAKKNILHIQIPFKNAMSGLSEKMKLGQWKVKNANSLFTKSIVEKNWNTDIQYVHYPMINLPKATYLPNQKQKIILSVGRFFSHLHSKRQDVLLDAFIEMTTQHPKEMKEWKLVLAGPIEDAEYAKMLAEKAKGHPVELLHNLSRVDLLNLYRISTLYWHAAGFEVDQVKNPEKVEHFGISTVEAMSFGCLPVVVGKGGQVEVLGEELKELLWETKDELISKSLELVQNSTLRDSLAVAATRQAHSFGKDRFIQTLEGMLK